MREIIIIILVLGLILVANTIVQRHLDETSSNLMAKLENLQKKIEESRETENNEELKKLYKDLENEWAKVHKIWSVIVIHQELDNIEQALVKTKAGIDEGSLEDAFEEIETAMFFIDHVKEREKVTIENIF